MVSLVNTSVDSLSPFDPFYPNNALCTWHITAPQHQLIRFAFKKFDLAQPGDYMEIRENLQSVNAVIRKFTTKSVIKESWASKGNNLWIKFKSDNDSVGEGFELIWTFENKSKGITFTMLMIVTVKI